ncbi:MAG: FeoB-associated Cys-rich membrane protein [Clostridium sp.]|jgi:hypothetical protein|nr:FeoB-associated Cys-rich membrane protein [Clostridium sp.]
MLTFLSENLGTLAVGAALAALLLAVIISLVKKKKKGGCASCDCGCEGCTMHCGEAENPPQE